MLIREKLQFYESDCDTDIASLIHRAREVKRTIDQIGRELDVLIEECGFMYRAHSIHLTNLVFEMFHFNEPMAAILMCYHAIYSIVIYRIFLSLEPDTFNDLRSEIRRLSSRIWMLTDYGCETKPLGLPMLQAALLMTVDAMDWDSQEQLISVMNELDYCHRSKAGLWTREKLISRAMVLRGDSLT